MPPFLPPTAACDPVPSQKHSVTALKIVHTACSATFYTPRIKTCRAINPLLDHLSCSFFLVLLRFPQQHISPQPKPPGPAARGCGPRSRQRDGLQTSVRAAFALSVNRSRVKGCRSEAHLRSVATSAIDKSDLPTERVRLLSLYSELC